MLMLFLFALFVQGTLSAQNFSAIAPAECVSGEEFYNPAHPRFLLYCIQPGSYNVTACLDTTFSKVPFNSYVDLAEATYKHLGFRYQCLLIEDQKQKIARLQYTGCVDIEKKSLTAPGSTFVDPVTKQTCICSHDQYFSCE